MTAGKTAAVKAGKWATSKVIRTYLAIRRSADMSEEPRMSGGSPTAHKALKAGNGATSMNEIPPARVMLQNLPQALVRVQTVQPTAKDP